MDGNTARVRSIDVFKGVAILIIVFCHICFATKSDVGSPNAVIQTLYLGLMVFLMISGYFYRPERSFAENMKKRVTVLLLALVICCVFTGNHSRLIYRWRTRKILNGNRRFTIFGQDRSLLYFAACGYTQDNKAKQNK